MKTTNAANHDFFIPRRGCVFGEWHKDELDRDVLVRGMSGADELDALKHEIDEFARRVAPT